MTVISPHVHLDAGSTYTDFFAHGDRDRSCVHSESGPLFPRRSEGYPAARAADCTISTSKRNGRFKRNRWPSPLRSDWVRAGLLPRTSVKRRRSGHIRCPVLRTYKSRLLCAQSCADGPETTRSCSHFGSFRELQSGDRHQYNLRLVNCRRDASARLCAKFPPCVCYTLPYDNRLCVTPVPDVRIHALAPASAEGDL